MIFRPISSVRSTSLRDAIGAWLQSCAEIEAARSIRTLAVADRVAGPAGRDTAIADPVRRRVASMAELSSACPFANPDYRSASEQIRGFNDERDF